MLQSSSEMGKLKGKCTCKGCSIKTNSYSPDMATATLRVNQSMGKIDSAAIILINQLREYY